jgi:hypothetical protein
MAGPTGAIISVIDQDFFHGLQISAPPGFSEVFWSIRGTTRPGALIPDQAAADASIES